MTSEGNADASSACETGGRRRPRSKILLNGLPGDRHAVTMQDTIFQKHLHHPRNAACFMKVGCDVLARRLQIAQHRHFFLDAFEILDRQRHLCRMGDGKQM